MTFEQQKPSLEEALAHYGIKGMKWGVHRDRDRPGGADGKSNSREERKAEKKLRKADAKWEKAVAKDIYKIHNDGAQRFNARIGALNDKHPKANLIDNPNSPESKRYLKDVNDLMAASHKEAVKNYTGGKSPSGKVQLAYNENEGVYGFVRED